MHHPNDKKLKQQSGKCSKQTKGTIMLGFDLFSYFYLTDLINGLLLLSRSLI